MIGIFSEMVNEYMEIFMDDFTPYGSSFDEALENQEKVVKHCEQTHLSLGTKKYHMMMSEGIVLRNSISTTGIQVDPAKIKVIMNIPIPGTQKGVCSFLENVIIMDTSLKKFLR